MKETPKVIPKLLREHCSLQWRWRMNRHKNIKSLPVHGWFNKTRNIRNAYVKPSNELSSISDKLFNPSCASTEILYTNERRSIPCLMIPASLCQQVISHDNDSVRKGGPLLHWERIFHYLLYFNVMELYNIVVHSDGLVQDCGISCANILKILQTCTEPSIDIHLSSKQFITERVKYRSQFRSIWWWPVVTRTPEVLVMRETRALEGERWSRDAWDVNMMTSVHGNAFHITGLLWGESIGKWWFLLTKSPEIQGFDVSFVVNLNKQSSCWWVKMTWYNMSSS